MGETITALDPAYSTLINSIMTVERQPVVRLTQQRDQITLQRSIYNDLRKMLDDLQSAVRALNSKDAFYAMTSGRAARVTGAPSGSTVFSASAGSAAAPGTYQIGVTSLAKEHRVRSDRQDYIDQRLGLSGQFILGGLAARAVSGAVVNSTVTGLATGEVATGQTELGSDTYYVETRNDAAAGWQFRLVNAAGEAQSIRTASGDISGEWQAVTANSTHDTGRGLTITFGDSAGLQALNRFQGAAAATYAAQGASIAVAGTDSLVNIAAKINAAAYADGNKVHASIVDNQLVLTNGRSGEGRLIQAADVTGGVLSGLGILNAGAFKNPVQAPSNAVMTVNGLTVTRSKNSGLSDVISGVNLNLAADAEGKSASLEISADYTNETNAIKTFIEKYNKMLEYLNAKVAVTKNSDGTYTRGALSNDSVFISMRLDLARQVNMSYATGGKLQNLTDIGITLSDSFQLSLSASAKFEEALGNNRNGVTALLDSVMGALNTTLGRFTGSSGYVATISNSLDERVKSMNDQIETWNTRLSKRQEQLIQQYAAVQTQISQMTYLSQQMSNFWRA